MQKKQAFYEKAKMLYVESGLSLIQISEVTTVSTRTLSDWKKEGNWDEKRVNFVKMQNSCCANLYKMLTGLTNQVNDKIMNNKEVDKALVWSIEKIAKSIPKLRPYEKDNIHEETSRTEDPKITCDENEDLSARIADLVDKKLTGEL